MIFPIYIVPSKFILKIQKKKINRFIKARYIASCLRLNTLSIIKKAGSGHIGTSMSAMDIFVWIKFFYSPNHFNNLKNKNRNIFFSSKGHDAPALYSCLYGLNIIKKNQFTKLRRLGGLDGHPDVSIRGVEANTGSLGMGISKAKGYAWAKKYLKKKGDVIVLIGDGEFQEGQIFESLQNSAHQKISNLIVIMDHNKIQSSDYVKNIINLRDLKKKISSFGWEVEQCDGHNFKHLNKILEKLKKSDKPKFIIANTIKGKGIKEMEHTKVMKKQRYYSWHAGAPTDEVFIKSQNYLISNIKKIHNKIDLEQLNLVNISNNKTTKESKKVFEAH
jgi:transketolase